jgi:hypothetical protein
MNPLPCRTPRGTPALPSRSTASLIGRRMQHE